VLYAVRAVHAGNRRRGARPLETDWTGLLAASIGTGLDRLAAETTLTRQRVLLQQAFPPALVHQLVREPHLLDERQQDVALLFADVRGSSQMLQTGTAATCRQLSQVLEILSDCVLDHEGTIVDFFGDGLLAMWNAPHRQADHPDRAVSAAWHMQRVTAEQMPSVRLAIGVHVGSAVVGNAGSRRRIKYGPRGAAVHAVNRLERVAKQADVPIVVSQVVQAALQETWSTRPLRPILLPGNPTPTMVFLLCGPVRPQAGLALPDGSGTDQSRD
jgi:adenylate cyclase